MSYFTGRETDDVKIAADQAYTRRWMKEQARFCDLHVSSVVREESSDGKDAEQVKERLDFCDSLPYVEFDIKKAAALAKRLMVGHAIPGKQTSDALHVAVASVAGMDFLLTWNCKHMANPHALPKTKSIVEKAGFRCPDIMTPKTFLENLDLEV